MPVNTGKIGQEFHLICAVVELITVIYWHPKLLIEHLTNGRNGYDKKNLHLYLLLHYPHQYESGKRYPLVVMIHGGPFGADLDAWQEGWWYETNIMCQQGAFVFKVNYHGSSNYGLKFAESIAGGEKYYDLPIEDTELGVDELISRGLVDGDKLGVLGW